MIFANFLAGWYMNDLSVCDDLINHFESNIDKTNTGNLNGIVDKSKKDFQELYISEQSEIIKRYLDELSIVCANYKEQFPECSETPEWRILEYIKIKRYLPGQGYHVAHHEKSGKHQLDRHLVFMTYLNDIELDGETYFIYQNLKIQPRKGLTLIWPADWTHTHKGIVSNTETKYIINGWYSFLREENYNE